MTALPQDVVKLLLVNAVCNVLIDLDFDIIDKIVDDVTLAGDDAVYTISIERKANEEDDPDGEAR